MQPSRLALPIIACRSPWALGVRVMLEMVGVDVAQQNALADCLFGQGFAYVLGLWSLRILTCPFKDLVDFPDDDSAYGKRLIAIASASRLQSSLTLSGRRFRSRLVGLE